MNERIKELIEQAQIDDIAFDKWGDAYDIKRLDPEKFAELLIRQCAKVVDDKLDFENASGPDDWASGDDVLEHFGVEK